MTATEHTVTPDGIDLYYQLRGEGPPLLLLHGTTGSSGDWKHLFDLDQLARDYRIIAPDLRGHGRTSLPGGTLTQRECALDVLALLDHLGVDRVRAVGVSLGGNILLHLATRQPARVEAMVLVAATMYYPEEARQIMRLATFDDLSAAELADLRATHPGGDDQIRALYRYINAFADDRDDLSFTPAHLSVITAPTLVVNGDRDPLYPVEMSVDLYRAIPRAALYVIPGGGHAPVYGNAREPFVRTALSFLRDPASTAG